jgi:hypothetical protein
MNNEERERKREKKRETKRVGGFYLGFHEKKGACACFVFLGQFVTLL